MLGKKKKEKSGLSGEASDRIIEQAVQAGASDIHIDPERDSTRVRFRINGALHLIDDLPKQLHNEILGRIKVMAGVDVVERRIPQDGHLEVTINDKIISLRISTFPTSYGEAIAMRLLNRESTLIPFENLGFDESQYNDLNKLIYNPYGVTLITGPSNSGKTTLLYSILHKLKSSETNIVTVEDPIELEMDGIRQTQINERIGFTFAKAMRSILRQDPDIVMLGEIRDADTIQMATNAALAGRLVFATFHTFDVPALVIRLREMGIPQSVLGHAFLGVVSTRLLRKICPKCVTTYIPNEFEKQLLGEYVMPELRKGKGCEVCYNSGYSSLIRIAEIVRFNDLIRSAILEKKPITELARAVKETQGKSLWDLAMEHVKKGETTIQEVIRVAGLPEE